MAKHTPYDGREREIKLGGSVAFNLSGSIAVGEVVDIKMREIKTSYGPGFRVEYQFKVQMSVAMHGYPAGHISTVKQPSSILVL